MHISGKGTVLVKKLIKGQWKDARIEDVLYVPQIRKNLFSVGICAKKGYCVSFKEKTVFLKKDKEIQAVGYIQENNIYRLLFKVIPQNNNLCREANVTATTLQKWHERLGHINKKSLKQVIASQAVQGVKLTCEKDFFCEPCQLSKAHRLKFNKNNSKESRWKPGEFIHTDICGPFSEMSIGGARYYLLFLDEATDYRTIYFIKHKSDVLEKLKEFNERTKNKFGYNIKTLRADNGREYANQQVEHYLKKQGIIMESTVYSRTKRKS